MSNYAEYITPKQAKQKGDTRSLKELKALVNQKGKCIVCKQPIWKYGGQGMCFSCTTGESDASEDYEIH